MSSLIEITPNPLITSTIEVRFSSNKKSSDIFSLVYAVFIRDFPEFKVTGGPKDINEGFPQSEFLPDYILSNDSYSFGFSDKVAVFENINQYTLWGNYFPFIQSVLLKIFDLGFINYIERIGLRYISVLNREANNGKIFKNKPALNLDGYTESFKMFHTSMKKDDCKITLHIADSATVTKKTESSEIQYAGIYLDIDASFTMRISPSVEVVDRINGLHTVEKDVFIQLVELDYLNALNAKFN